MPFLDRNGLIDLLNRLGSPDDADALAAARDIDRRVRDAGIGWDALLTSAGTSIEGSLFGSLSDDELDTPPRPPSLEAEDSALIDRLLAEYPLSDTTRQELTEFKAAIAEGEFTDMDARYLRDLASRLERHRRPDE